VAYSLPGSCKAAGVNPSAWLEDVLTKVLYLPRMSNLDVIYWMLTEDQMEWIDSVSGQLHPPCGYIYGNVQREAEVTVML